MTPANTPVGPETPLRRLAATISRLDKDVVAVTDPAGRFLGLVGPEELAAAADAPRVTAGQVMKAAAHTASMEDDVRLLARRMIETGALVVPVVENGRIVGICRRERVLRDAARAGDEGLEAAVRRMLWRCGLTAPEYVIRVAARHGTVVLEGHAPTVEDARVVAAIVSGLDHVERVDDRISVAAAAGARR